METTKRYDVQVQYLGVWSTHETVEGLEEARKFRDIAQDYYRDRPYRIVEAGTEIEVQ